MRYEILSGCKEWIILGIGRSIQFIGPNSHCLSCSPTQMLEKSSEAAVPALLREIRSVR
jgi:hypothetical protein